MSKYISSNQSSHGVSYYILMPLILISLSLSSFLFLISSSASADNGTVNDVTITVPVSCNMASNVNTAHSTEIVNGMSKEDIGTTTFNIFCNDNNGFSVYAIGYSGEEYGNTNMLATVGGVASSSDNIATGLATSGNSSAWAMKLAKVDGTYEPTILSDTEGSFTNYHTIPSTYTKVATLSSNTDFTTGSSFTSTYRAYISTKQPAGTYQGKVKYTLVHPNDAAAPTIPVTCPANNICYDGNGNTSEFGMGNQEATSNTETTLWAANYAKANHGFAGWNTKADGTGTTYGPNQTLTAEQVGDLSTNGLQLYAKWIPSAGNLQDWDGCSSLSQGSVTALTDTRDNDTYAVAKLADGNCWMIENLRLGGDQPINLTTSDSALSVDFTLPASDANAPWSNWTAIYIYAVNTLNPITNMTTPSTTNIFNSNLRHDETIAGIYSYGNYYTWAAAIGTATEYWSGSSPGTSICPKGWSLPLGGNTTKNGSFSALDRALGGTGANQTNAAGITQSAKWRSFPNNYVYSGSKPSGSYAITDAGSFGAAWSASSGSEANTYAILIQESRLRPGSDYARKSNEYSVRCILGT